MTRPRPSASSGAPTGVEASADVPLVDDPRRLATTLGTVDEPFVGLDVERDDGECYYRRAALIQVGTGSACVLVDPLAIDDLGTLADFLAERTTILHSLENDLVPLANAGIRLVTGVRPAERRRVEDTQVAAAMLGLPVGLSTLLEEELGARLSTDKDRYQRAPWEQRPLSRGMRRYAVEDVAHLPALWELLSGRLERAGRIAWYGQELLATIEATRGDSRHWTRTSGAEQLEAAQRAVLKALWEEREAIARESDVAPNLLLHDDTLRSLAEDPAGDAADLVRRNGRRRPVLTEHADRLLQAQRRGLRAAPAPAPSPRATSREHRELHDALRRTRNRIARELELDPGVLCPNRQLWHAVHDQPGSAAALGEAAGLRPWQHDVLGSELWHAYLGSDRT